MDSIPTISLPLGNLVAFLLFFFSLLLWTVVNYKKNKNGGGDGKAKEPPQPRGALPYIGHMRLLKEKRPLAHTLGALADDLGPVFMLRLGVRRTLIVSSSDAARECFTTNDEAFATRPRNPAGKLMGYDFAMMGFAPYGTYWRGIRKLAAVELLSKARLALLKDVRAAEVGVCVRELYRLWGENGKEPVVVNMKQWMGNVTFNVVVKIVAGKRYFGTTGGGGFSEEGWVFRKAISRFFRLMKTLVVSDMLPYLRWMDVSGHDSAMRDAFRDIDQVVSGWLGEHRKRKVSGAVADGDRDFMDTILSIIEDSEVVSMRDPDTIIKAISMSLILGSTDTTTNSLTLTLASLLNHPDVLGKIREELDAQVGRDRTVDETDIKNLIYLQAAVKEAFRLHPTSQFLQPHEAMQDCTVGGYRVPAGTRLLVNVWKLQRDLSVWDDPLEFRPERFLTTHSHVDVRGNHFELIPFGSGRRSCPGITFALHVMHLTIARLVHEFDMRTPTGAAVEMSAGLGSTLDPTPLEVVLTPRLSCHLHENWEQK